MTRAERVEPAAGTEPAAARVRAHPSPALRRRRRGRALLYVAAVLLSLWVLVLIYLITVTAFTPRRAIFDFPKPVVPRQVSAETVSFFAHSSGVLAALVTSVVVALITLAISTTLGARAAVHGAGHLEHLCDGATGAGGGGPHAGLHAARRLRAGGAAPGASGTGGGRALH